MLRSSGGKRTRPEHERGLAEHIPNNSNAPTRIQTKSPEHIGALTVDSGADEATCNMDSKLSSREGTCEGQRPRCPSTTMLRHRCAPPSDTSSTCADKAMNKSSMRGRENASTAHVERDQHLPLCAAQARSLPGRPRQPWGKATSVCTESLDSSAVRPGKQRRRHVGRRHGRNEEGLRSIKPVHGWGPTGLSHQTPKWRITDDHVRFVNRQNTPRSTRAEGTEGGGRACGFRNSPVRRARPAVSGQIMATWGGGPRRCRRPNTRACCIHRHRDAMHATQRQWHHLRRRFTLRRWNCGMQHENGHTCGMQRMWIDLDQDWSTLHSLWWGIRKSKSRRPPAAPDGNLVRNRPPLRHRTSREDGHHKTGRQDAPLLTTPRNLRFGNTAKTPTSNLWLRCRRPCSGRLQHKQISYPKADEQYQSTRPEN